METRLPTATLLPFLHLVRSENITLIASTNSLDFVDDSCRKYLGDLITPPQLWKLMNGNSEFIQTYDKCIRACLSRWEATPGHPEYDRYFILVKSTLPKLDTKQTEMFE